MSINPTAMEPYREIMGEEADAFIADIINTFMVSAPKLVADMERNISRNEKQTFIRNAHTLKSNSGTVGASKLSELAAILEEAGSRSDLPTLAGKLREAKAELKLVIAFFRR